MEDGKHLGKARWKKQENSCLAKDLMNCTKGFEWQEREEKSHLHLTNITAGKLENGSAG